MLHLLGNILSLALTGGLAVFGYWQARQFTQNKLRYVDAVHKTLVPVMVGIAAALLATPVAWVLPFIGTGTALLFGGGVAMGVAAGAREIRKRIGAG